jgi:hypothetical protein
MTTRTRLLAAVATIGFATPAHGWEAQTTHAGLTEQAASSSRLHDRLVALGFTGGLYAPLTVPPADAPPLLAALARYSPTHGFVPDNRGRQFAIGWLVAGAVLADSSPEWSIHHFYDPTTRRGATLSETFSQRLSTMFAERLGRARVPSRGMAAPDWVTAKDNPLGLAGFIDQYGKAVRAETPGERSRHMAGALVAAGAILHVLEDMGSPSHVRDDLRAHLDRLGPARDDLGSRFERIAALAYGRLGIPSAQPVARPTLRAFFTDGDGAGLADLVSSSWFSGGTLPRAIRLPHDRRDRDVLRARQAAALVKPSPALPAMLSLMTATTAGGATLDGPGGVCLARYRVDDGVLRFSTDDDCMLDQVGVILPQVVGYAAGLVDWLFRGELVVTSDPRAAGSVIVSAVTGLGAGTVTVLAEDSRGVRSVVASQGITAGAVDQPVVTAVVPADAAAVYAVFEGADAGGEPVVATGRLTPAEG